MSAIKSLTINFLIQSILPEIFCKLNLDGKGLNKITPNKKVINEELDNNWEVLTEAVQTLMRLEGINDAYEQLKRLSRGKRLDKTSYIEFVKTLDISTKSKEKLLKLTPHSYVGLAKKL